MRTNAASSVKDGRYYLQLAGAEARERLLLAAAKAWGVPVEEVSGQQRHHAPPEAAARPPTARLPHSPRRRRIRIPRRSPSSRPTNGR